MNPKDTRALSVAWLKKCVLAEMPVLEATVRKQNEFPYCYVFSLICYYEGKPQMENLRSWNMPVSDVALFDQNGPEYIMGILIDQLKHVMAV